MAFIFCHPIFDLNLELIFNLLVVPGPLLFFDFVQALSYSHLSIQQLIEPLLHFFILLQDLLHHLLRRIVVRVIAIINDIVLLIHDLSCSMGHLIPSILERIARWRLIHIRRLRIVRASSLIIWALWTLWIDILSFISCLTHLIGFRCMSDLLFAWLWERNSHKRWFLFLFDQYLLLRFGTHYKLLLRADNDPLTLLLDHFAAHASKYFFDFLTAAQNNDKLWEILHLFDSQHSFDLSGDFVNSLCYLCLKQWLDNIFYQIVFDRLVHHPKHKIQLFVVRLLKIFELATFLQIKAYSSELHGHLFNRQVHKVDLHLSYLEFILNLAPRNVRLINNEHDCETETLQVVSPAWVVSY